MEWNFSDWIISRCHDDTYCVAVDLCMYLIQGLLLKAGDEWLRTLNIPNGH